MYTLLPGLFTSEGAGIEYLNKLKRALCRAPTS